MTCEHARTTKRDEVLYCALRRLTVHTAVCRYCNRKPYENPPERPAQPRKRGCCGDEETPADHQKDLAENARKRRIMGLPLAPPPGTETDPDSP